MFRAVLGECRSSIIFVRTLLRSVKDLGPVFSQHGPRAWCIRCMSRIMYSSRIKLKLDMLVGFDKLLFSMHNFFFATFYTLKGYFLCPMEYMYIFSTILL